MHNVENVSSMKSLSVLSRRRRGGGRQRNTNAHHNVLFLHRVYAVFGDTMKLLIADDSLVMRRITENRLKAAGYDKILHANSGLAVLKALDDNPDVDVVLLDWNMPAMNGLDCLRAIKSHAPLRDIHVVMVTSENVKTKIVEAVQSGACNYLIKPFEPEKLMAVLEGIRVKRRAGTAAVPAAVAVAG